MIKRDAGHRSTASPRAAARPDQGCLINLLALAGMLFILDAGLLVYPVLRDRLMPPPAAFGEAQPLLRPTVTPLHMEGQAVITATPVLLPETPLLATDRTLPPLIAAAPVITGAAPHIPTRLVIPAIDLDAPIETVGWSQPNGVSVWDIPNHFAAGWLKTSAPIGQPGNTVFDGHHNMAGEVFRRLVDLKSGDLIEVRSNERAYSYQVTALHILPDRDEPIEVRRQNAIWIQPTLDERLTLVTCWPYTDNTHRLIVVAKPIGPG
ncbi:MAG: sortase [Chloroflexi bacterium]|nr:sortase [Chloroflexota bacterium]